MAEATGGSSESKQSNLVRYTPLPCDVDGIARAASMLRAGKCVAFPTETVYGLGANALDAAAVQSIFTFKGRPLTDPLIVHVDSKAKAADLVRLPSARARAVFDALASRFWPGPLTLVARACDRIPATVTAGTGFVGVRVPAHPLAAALLAAADIPVAAPSANRFGHVSPTRAAHVASDLGGHPIGILMAEGMPAATGGSSDISASEPLPAPGLTCGVGIESTVAKVEVVAALGDAASVDSSDDYDPPLQLVVFRRGGVSVAQLQAALASAGVGDVPVVFRTMHSTAAAPLAPAPAAAPAPDAAPVLPLAASSSSAGGAAAVASTSSGSGSSAAARCEPSPPSDHHNPAASASAAVEGGAISGGSEAPGMLLSHYAPDGVTTYLVSASASAVGGISDAAVAVCLIPAISAPDHASTSAEAATSLDTSPAPVPLDLDLPRTVVLDFGGQLSFLSSRVLAYRDLSPAGSVPSAAAALFEALRWTESVAGAAALLLADPAAAPPAVSDADAPSASSAASSGSTETTAPQPSVDVDALRDRMFRAASGRVVQVNAKRGAV